MLTEVVAALEEFDAAPDLRCAVLAGSSKAFAAGSDIAGMAALSYADVLVSDWYAGWERLRGIRKPVIAAVAGYALGGGCELAMMADIIVAADNAQFGQPEVKLGVMPGMGGSQRLTRAVGKAKAMELCLTGRFMDAAEAERSGLVARVVQLDQLDDAVRELAESIAAKSLPSLLLIKEAVNRSFEVSLAEGVLHERRLFHSLFATLDQKEGMGAFLDKRAPEFLHQ
jgi:enoyl-CoA hydratase